MIALIYLPLLPSSIVPTWSYLLRFFSPYHTIQTIIDQDAPFCHISLWHFVLAYYDKNRIL
jgi:hypothetical protein